MGSVYFIKIKIKEKYLYKGLVRKDVLMGCLIVFVFVGRKGGLSGELLRVFRLCLFLSSVK